MLPNFKNRYLCINYLPLIPEVFYDLFAIKSCPAYEILQSLHLFYL